MYSAAIPQRADMVLERCTNAVATPFGVTGALQRTIYQCYYMNKRCTIHVLHFILHINCVFIFHFKDKVFVYIIILLQFRNSLRFWIQSTKHYVLRIEIAFHNIIQNKGLCVVPSSLVLTQGNEFAGVRYIISSHKDILHRVYSV